MTLNRKFFQKQTFNPVIIKRYFNKAKYELDLGKDSKWPEIQFTQAYKTLIRIGITLMATLDYRVKSQEGHHIVIIDNLAEMLDDKRINTMGDDMRIKRNVDWYGDSIPVTEQESMMYLSFVEEVIKRAEEYLTRQKRLF